jgi:putative Holliday junction resolvase
MQLLRLAAIDFGERKIGLAISDPNQTLSLPLPTLYVKHNTSLEKTIDDILKILNAYALEAIVVGHPLEMKGTVGHMAHKVQAFATLLEQRSSYKTILWDERLSSKQADALLKEENIKRKKRDAMNDSLSAALLLQSYLDYLALKK